MNAITTPRQLEKQLLNTFTMESYAGKAPDFLEEIYSDNPEDFETMETTTGVYIRPNRSPYFFKLSDALLEEIAEEIQRKEEAIGRAYAATCESQIDNGK